MVTKLTIISVIFCTIIPITTLVMLGINYGVGDTYPLLYGTTFLSVLEWPFFIFWIMYPDKLDHFMKNFIGFISFIEGTAFQIILTNTLVMTMCLYDYPADDGIVYYLQDEFPSFYQFMIGLMVINIVRLLILFYIVSNYYKIGKNNPPVYNIPLVPIIRNNYEIVRDFLLVSFSMACLVFSVIILITNTKIITTLHAPTYLLSYTSLFPWMLFVILMFLAYYKRRPVISNATINIYFYYSIIFSHFILFPQSLFGGSCITEEVKDRLMDTYFEYYVWSSIFSALNFVIYCFYYYIDYQNKLNVGSPIN